MSRSRPAPARTSATTVRCAVYTRKSSEEGLEQEFNSLDAQRESGENYIASQAGEGWTCLPDRYDDGGFTGGKMERPALRRLMADIESGKVVYAERAAGGGRMRDPVRRSAMALNPLQCMDVRQGGPSLLTVAEAAEMVPLRSRRFEIVRTGEALEAHGIGGQGGR